jgi:hypothetical protein
VDSSRDFLEVHVSAQPQHTVRPKWIGGSERVRVSAHAPVCASVHLSSRQREEIERQERRRDDPVSRVMEAQPKLAFGPRP